MLLFTTLHPTEDTGLSDKPVKSQIWAAMFVNIEFVFFVIFTKVHAKYLTLGAIQSN